MSDKACQGGTTIPHHKGHGLMETCQHCDLSVAHDMVEDKFFGFQAACPIKKKDTYQVGGKHHAMQCRSELPSHPF